MQLPPELELVVACCRWPRSAQRNAAIRRAAEPPIAWTHLRDVAARHRVEGLVHDGLKLAGVAVPQAIEDELSREAAGIARQNLVFAAASVRLQTEFATAKIGFLFVKGVTLNILAYGSLGLKRGWDIDVAVDPTAYEHACRVIQEGGYRCVSPGPDCSQEQLRAWVARHKHTIWRNRNLVHVELHSSLVDNPLLLSEVSVKSPRQEVRVASGMELSTLNSDALFSYLCVHGASHAWSRLKWIADVAALLKDAGPAEIERIYAVSQGLGAGRASGQALLLCARLFGLDLGVSLQPALRRDLVTRMLVRLALGSMVRGGAGAELDAQTFGTVPIHLSHFFLLGGWLYKGAELRRKLMPSQSAGGGLSRMISALAAVPVWLLQRAGRRRTAR